MWWLCLVVLAILRKQRPPPITLITPIVVLPLVVLGFITVPTNARWLLTEPAFNSIIEQAGPPAVRPVNPTTKKRAGPTCNLFIPDRYL